MLASGDHSMEEDHEALFRPFPCADYYVQSPFSASQANSPECGRHSSLYLSGDFPLTALALPIAENHCPEASCLFLSNYSSSRGSNNSFVQEKKVDYGGLQSHRAQRAGCNSDDDDHGLLIKATGKAVKDDCNDDGDDEDEIGFDGDRRRSSNSLIKFFSFSYSSTWYCIVFQIVWRFMISVGIALLLFFLITRPPPPKISAKVARIREFELREGVDYSGVASKILACNVSIDLEVDNRSKFFNLHTRPPVISIAFGRLTFATTQAGDELLVPGDSLMTFQLNIGTKTKAVYAAGRAMEDMLQSGQGLPLLIRLQVQSIVPVVWNLIELRFDHRTDCLAVLKDGYDQKHRTEVYNSTCNSTLYA